MIFIIDKFYPHSHPLQISDFRFQISEWPIFRVAEQGGLGTGKMDNEQCRMANLPRSGSADFYWHLTPWPPLLESLSRAKAREEGEKGVGG